MSRKGRQECETPTDGRLLEWGWQPRFGEPQGRQGMDSWMERWPLSFIGPLSLK